MYIPELAKLIMYCVHACCKDIIILNRMYYVHNSTELVLTNHVYTVYIHVVNTSKQDVLCTYSTELYSPYKSCTVYIHVVNTQLF